MENNWPETIDELMEECKMLVGKTDIYELGERGEPFTGESEPRVDGTDYLAGEYQYGVAMIPAQWVTSVLFRYWQMGWLDQLRDSGTRYHELFGTPELAARTLIDCNAFKQCVDCPVCHDEHGETCEIPGDCVFVMRDYHKLSEWLKGGAE